MFRMSPVFFFFFFFFRNVNFAYYKVYQYTQVVCLCRIEDSITRIKFRFRENGSSPVCKMNQPGTVDNA